MYDYYLSLILRDTCIIHAFISASIFQMAITKKIPNHSNQSNSTMDQSEFLAITFKVHMTRNFLLFEKAFKMMKNGVYFIVIALLVAELFKMTCDVIYKKFRVMYTLSCKL